MTRRKVLSWLLFPLTMWYALGVAIRNFLFAVGLLREECPHITTIGLGNLAVGGTGKTPHAVHVLSLLSEHYRVAYLSRGYRRQSRGFVLCEGEPDARRIGDEAAMIARRFPSVVVAVCEKRSVGIEKLMQQTPAPQLIVLDDVFQHRFVKPTINILLTEYNRPFYADHILPYGNLREFRGAKRRANIIIVSRTPDNENPITHHNVLNDIGALPYQSVFFSSMRYEELQPVYGSATAPSWDEIDEVVLFAGIAHYDGLLSYVRSRCPVRFVPFADHHDYTVADLEQLATTFSKIKSLRKALVTTEKDAARLQTAEARSVLANLPIYFLPIHVEMQGREDYTLDTLLLSSVKENISFLEKLSNSPLVK